jgi:hypothetical protein
MRSTPPKKPYMYALPHGIVHVAEYGFRQSRDATGVTWYRDDGWTGLSGVHEADISFFAAGPNDYSRHALTANYDSRCASCFLGFGHTMDYHRKNLRESFRAVS